MKRSAPLLPVLFLATSTLAWACSDAAVPASTPDSGTLSPPAKAADAGHSDASAPAVDAGDDPQTPTGAVQVATSGRQACARLDNGEVKCWGAAPAGLGYGNKNTMGDAQSELGSSLPAIDFGKGRKALWIVAGSSDTTYHFCALLDDHRVKCWGNNDQGQLGLGDMNARGDDPGEMGDVLPYVDLGTGRTVKVLAASWLGTCAILDNDAVKCWGNNDYGMLGTGDKKPRGGRSGEMGDALPAIDLGQGNVPVDLAVGSASACALLNDGHVKCWGRNGFGQLGYGDLKDRGDNPGELGDALANLDFGEGRTVKSIVTTGPSYCALLDNDAVKCWGQNQVGQLGYGGTSSRGSLPGQMGDKLPVVDVGTGRKATKLFGGAYVACVVLDNATTKCWGYNDYGQLGIGDTQIRGDSDGEMGDKLPIVDVGKGRTIVSMSIGRSSTCAVTDDKSVKCWGNNANAQLGRGSIGGAIGDAPLEMGDNLKAVLLF